MLNKMSKKMRITSALLEFSAGPTATDAYIQGTAEVRDSAIGHFKRPSSRGRNAAFTGPSGTYNQRGLTHGPTPGSEWIYEATDRESFAARAHAAPSPFATVAP